MSPYQIVFGKPCHLLVEVEHKVYWAIRRINENINEVGLNRKFQINEFEEIRNKAFENAKVSKLNMKKLHDKHINRKILQIGQRVLLYDSKLHIFLGKLKSRWIRPFKIHSISSHKVFEIKNLELAQIFKVNGHRLKPYLEMSIGEEEDVDLIDPTKGE